MSAFSKFGCLGLSALLLLTTAAMTVVEGGGILESLWMAANTIFTTGFGTGPQSPAWQMVLAGTILLLAPLWIVTLVGVIETAAWRLEQRRVTGSTQQERRSPHIDGRR